MDSLESASVSYELEGTEYIAIVLLSAQSEKGNREHGLDGVGGTESRALNAARDECAWDAGHLNAVLIFVLLESLSRSETAG